jgi:branched-subunit amino acid transport protein
VTDALVVLLVLGGVTYVLKAAGPVLLGNRTLPPPVARVVDLLPAALLAALVATSVLFDGATPVLDARVVGVGAAGLVLARGGGFIPTVVAAAVVTALVRLVT